MTGALRRAPTLRAGALSHGGGPPGRHKGGQDLECGGRRHGPCAQTTLLRGAALHYFPGMSEHEKHPPVSPLTAGLRCHCPRCGEGRLFSSFTTLAKGCDRCGLDYAFADAGDGPAVFIILLVGFVVVAAALIVEVMYQPPYWLHALLWVPLILGLSLGMLRPLKAMLIAQQYRHKAGQGGHT